MSNKIVVKCYYNGEVRAVGTVKPSTTLKSLKKKVRKEFHRDLDLKYKDSEGDIIALKKPSHLRDAIKGTSTFLPLWFLPSMPVLSCPPPSSTKKKLSSAGCR